MLGRELPEACYCGGAFQQDVADELDRAKGAFPNMNSAHEGFAVLKEEVDELWDEVKVKQKDRDLDKMWRECVQVAAMAHRMAEDILVQRRGRI